MMLLAFCLFLASSYQLWTSASTSECNSSKQLIVAVLPDNKYYNNSFSDIEHFIEQMAQGTQGLDYFIVLYSKDLDDELYQQRYDSGLPFGDKTLHIVSNFSFDLWVRDFGLVGPAKQLKFKYLPKYLEPQNAKFSDGQFNSFLKNIGFQVTHSDIVLDGGNVVDNNWDKAIISERILEENKGKTKKELKMALQNLLNMTIAFIPDPDDTTGHSDGIVSFIEDDVVLIRDYNDPDYYNEVESSIKNTFPSVETIRLKCEDAADTKKRDKNWRGFTSAVGSYVNSGVVAGGAMGAMAPPPMVPRRAPKC